jgi:hypothetical protein
MKSHFLRSATTQSCSYRDTYTSGTNGTSFTFSSCDIGTEDTSRLVVVILGGTGTTSQGGVSPSLTIGGVAADRQVSIIDSSGTDTMALFTLKVTSGTTATIVATFNGQVARAAISVYALYNLQMIELPVSGFSAISVGSDSGDETSSSISINQRYGGIVIYTSIVFNNLTPPSLPTYTWSTSLGDTVTYDEITRVGGEVSVQATGSFRARYTGTNTITLTYDSVTRIHCTVAASFY